MKLKFKRDETSIVPPGKDQVDIGEIVINSVTGRLYTKTVTGEIVEFIGQKLCFSTIPEIKFYYEEADVGDNVGSFCCSGVKARMSRRSMNNTLSHLQLLEPRSGQQSHCLTSADSRKPRSRRRRSPSEVSAKAGCGCSSWF